MTKQRCTLYKILHPNMGRQQIPPWRQRGIDQTFPIGSYIPKFGNLFPKFGKINLRLKFQVKHLLTQSYIPKYYIWYYYIPDFEK